jgi:predicted phosphodiesterase
MNNIYKDRKKFKPYTVVKVPENVSIMVIGDVHEHSEQFFKLIDEWGPSENRWLVSVGDVYDKGFGTKEAERITDKLAYFQDKGICWAVRGNHELKVIKKNKNNLTSQLKWWKDQPLVLSFEFQRGERLSVVHAGISPKMDESQLGSNIEVCYIRDVDDDGNMIPLVWKQNENGSSTLVKSKEGGTSWHNLYDGRFGYIVSGHAAQKDGVAKFYNYSCNLDSGVYETGILTGQVFNYNCKLERLITVKGNAFKPELNTEY